MSEPAAEIGTSAEAFKRVLLNATCRLYTHVSANIAGEGQVEKWEFVPGRYLQGTKPIGTSNAWCLCIVHKSLEM